MSKLADFPLEKAGLGDAPDETVIVAWPGWNLTVGDVRAARENVDTPELRRLVNEYRHGCDMVQGHAIPQWRRLIEYLKGK